MATECTVMVSVFYRDIDEMCALLGHYTACNNNPLATFRYKVSVPSLRVRKFKNFLTFESLADMLSRNVGIKGQEVHEERFSLNS
jgi:hypothetical protein